MKFGSLGRDAFFAVPKRETVIFDLQILCEGRHSNDTMEDW